MHRERRKRFKRKKIVIYSITAAMFFSFTFFEACTGGEAGGGRSAQGAAAADTLYPQGKKIYQRTCITCHNDDGNGQLGTYPPLAKSDYLLADKFRAIRQVIKGSALPIAVNGATYSSMMPPQPLNDEETAQVLNYVTHAWGNSGYTISAAEVKAVRDTLK